MPKAGRPAAAAPQDRTAKANEQALVSVQQAATQLAEAHDERQKRRAALAHSIGYDGELSDQALMSGARGAKQRVGAAIYELGAYLLLLNEGCDHGEFIPALDRIGIDRKSAARYMAVTRRFANVSTSRHLAELGISKMAELLPLDDEQIDKLAGDGFTGELALDDVSRMSVMELRKAVRKERSDRDRWKTAAQESQEQLVLSRNLKLAATDWPERFKGLLDQVDLAHRALVGNVEGLAKIMVAGFEDQPAPGEEENLDIARALLAERMAQAIDTSFDRLERLRSVFDRGLRNFCPEA